MLPKIKTVFFLEETKNGVFFWKNKAKTHFLWSKKQKEFFLKKLQMFFEKEKKKF